MKYLFPAIFTPEKKDMYSVRFPDIEGCYTCGDSLSDAVNMAEDVLCLMLYDMENSNIDIPEPSNMNDIKHDSNEFVSLIKCDTEFYRKFYKNKVIKKTLTIPEWMNIAGTERGLNFSQVLQEALREKLGLN